MTTKIKRTLGIKRTYTQTLTSGMSHRAGFLNHLSSPVDKRASEFLSCLGNGRSIIEIEQEEEDEE